MHLVPTQLTYKLLTKFCLTYPVAVSPSSWTMDKVLGLLQFGIKQQSALTDPSRLDQMRVIEARR